MLRRKKGDRGISAGAGGEGAGDRGVAQTNAGIGLLSVGLILVQEVLLAAESGRAEMGLWLIIAMAILLLTMIVSLVAVAMERIADPLGLPFARRETYVYIAEAILVVLGVHIRLTCPELFTGFFVHFWPAVVMVVSFALAGVGEVLDRRGVKVVGGPIGRTAFVLPLLPAMLFGVLRSELDYGVVLVSVAVFYGLIAGARKSAWRGCWPWWRPTGRSGHCCGVRRRLRSAGIRSCG